MNKEFRISDYIVKSEIPSNYKEKDIIIFSTRTGNIVTIKEELFRKITNNDIENIEKQTLKSLYEHKIIIPKDEIEKQTIIEENRELEKIKTGISFVIQPTGNCQLGCFYCGQSHTNIKMSDITVGKVYDRITDIIRREGYESLFITWYGGEPLLALNSIEILSRKLITFCQENGISYNADIITNGVLLKKDTFRKLIDYKVRLFQITLDGTKYFHDNRRVTKGGKGSFDIIMKNIVECVEENVSNNLNSSFNIRLNIDKENVVAVDELIDYFHSLNLVDKVNFSFSPIFDWGGNKANTNNIDIRDFSEKEIDWILKIHDLGGHIDVSLPSRKHAPCMVANKDYEVFDAFGNIFPCYELPYTKIYQNEDYIEGNLRTNKTIIKTGKLREFVKNLEKGENICIDCEFFPVCASSCPKSWLAGDIACPTFKFNIEDKILLYYYLKKLK